MRASHRLSGRSYYCPFVGCRAAVARFATSRSWGRSTFSRPHENPGRDSWRGTRRANKIVSLTLSRFTRARGRDKTRDVRFHPVDASKYYERHPRITPLAVVLYTTCIVVCTGVAGRTAAAFPVTRWKLLYCHGVLRYGFIETLNGCDFLFN